MYSFQLRKVQKLKEKGENRNINEKTLYLLADTRINSERLEKIETQFKKDKQGNSRLYTTISKPKNPRHGASLILPEDMTEMSLQ